LNYARESGLGEKQGLTALTVTRLRSRDVRAAQLIRHSDKAPDTPAADALLVEPARQHLSVNTFSELATVPT
jgi:hypothetical protein